MFSLNFTPLQCVLAILGFYIVFAVMSIFSSRRQLIELPDEYEEIGPIPGWQRIVLVTVTIAMILLCAGRPESLPDIRMYINSMRVNDTDYEPGYLLLQTFTHNVLYDNYFWLFLMVACISVPLKIWAIIRTSRYVWCALLIYLSSKFILQDLIQIRAAVATGFFLVSLKYLVRRNMLKYALCCGGALLFHWSALMMIPVWFLKAKKINGVAWIVAIVISYLLGIMGIYATEAIGFIPIEAVQKSYEGYTSTNNMQSQYNLFSIVSLSRTAVCILLLAFYKKIHPENPYYAITAKIYAVSFMIYCLFGNLTVAAIRMSEFYQAVEILQIPMLCLAFRWPIIGKVCVMAIAALYIWFNVFATSYFF